MPDLVPSPLTSAVETLIARAKANDGHLPLTEIAAYLGLDIAVINDEREELALETAPEISDLSDEEAERVVGKLDIAEVLSALATAGVVVSDEVEESRLEDDVAYLAHQVATVAVSEGDLDARSLLMRELGNHPILSREEETERTTRIALLNRTVKELDKSRERISRRADKLKLDAESREISAKAIIAELEADEDLDAAARLIMVAETMVPVELSLAEAATAADMAPQ